MGKFTGKRIGIIGGFGAYATLDFYKRLLDSFEVTSERDYPDMIIDNVYSMPSRTRALLTGGGHEEIVAAITKSMKKMLDYDADCIVMVCGTAHYFLPYVYENLPKVQPRVINILDATGRQLWAKNVGKVLVLAAEGTLKQGLYAKTLAKYDIACIEPAETDWHIIRYFIECVKNDNYDDELNDKFFTFLAQYDIKNVILGCTEFPVLLKHVGDDRRNYNFFDPLSYAIREIHERFS